MGQEKHWKHFRVLEANCDIEFWWCPKRIWGRQVKQGKRNSYLGMEVGSCCRFKVAYNQAWEWAAWVYRTSRKRMHQDARHQNWYHCEGSLSGGKPASKILESQKCTLESLAKAKKSMESGKSHCFSLAERWQGLRPRTSKTFPFLNITWHDDTWVLRCAHEIYSNKRPASRNGDMFPSRSIKWASY